MARIDAKCSGIMKNGLESVLHGLKSPILVFTGRYCDISSFSFVADHHFYLSPFNFWLLPRHLTQSAFAQTALTACHSREACRRRASMVVTNNGLLCVQCSVLHRTHPVLQQILKQVFMPSHHTKPCSHGQLCSFTYVRSSTDMSMVAAHTHNYSVYIRLSVHGT